MKLVIKSTKIGQQRCAEYCLNKGMGFVYGPTGTAGRYADGSWSDTEQYCHCVKKSDSIIK
jgi:hypothetical protein